MKTSPYNLGEGEMIIILDDEKEINIKLEEMYKELLKIYNLQFKHNTQRKGERDIVFKETRVKRI